MAGDVKLIKGSEVRKADYPIEPMLLDRWSPRAMSGEEISQEELMRLFEAARWAPSSFNAQQWRALYARRGTEHWQTFLDLLVDANKVWAKNAAVLVDEGGLFDDHLTQRLAFWRDRGLDGGQLILTLDAVRQSLTGGGEQARRFLDDGYRMLRKDTPAPSAPP